MAERLPGSMKAAARAAYNLGITTEATTEELFKAMEAGELMADEFLPALSKELMISANSGDALQKAINTTSAAYGRLATNVFMANKTFNEAGLDKGMRRLSNSISDFLLNSEGMIKFFGMLSGEILNRFGVVFEVLETFGVWSNKVGDGLAFLEKKGIDANVAFMVLTGTLSIISKWFRRIFMFVYLLPWALSLTADTLKGNFGDDMVDTITRVAVALGTLYGALRMIRKTRAGLGGLFKRGDKTSTGSSSASTSKSASRTASASASGGGGLSRIFKGGVSSVGAIAKNPYIMIASILGPMLVHELAKGNYTKAFSEDADQRFVPPGMNLMSPEEMANRRASNYLVQGGITINIDGADDPQTISEEVLRTIQNVFRETASLEPETEQ